MNARVFIVGVPVCILAVFASGTVGQEITIAEDGVSRAGIVVAADATAAERHAAEELAAFLTQITGGEFVISHGIEPGKSSLAVGPGAAKLVDASFTTDGLGEEGLIIRTVGDDLILAGGRPRGTLYAVYTFLEDELGCRWWSTRFSTIPSKPTLRIGTLDMRFVPRFEYRESFWFDALDPDWAVRNECNGNWIGRNTKLPFPLTEFDPKRGGQQNYLGFVHTFYSLIQPEKYFDDHAEWFSEIDGKRTFDYAQLCLTNEEMRAELVKNLKEQLRVNPDVKIASVSQNDWIANCQCSRCAAVDAEEGSPAGSLLRFVNAVAAEIEDEFPDVAIDTLAYQYTRKPPAHIRPRQNVIVRLCSIECSFSVPLTDERNSAFRDDLVGWSKICDRLYVWDYTTNFVHYLMPHPNLRVLGPNVKFFADHGVRGVFEQGAYHCFGSEMAELRQWVLAKLLWDPTRDANMLIDEFLDGYYGPAAGPIREYLNMTHDAVEASGDYLGCFTRSDAKFLSLKLISEGLALFGQAEAMAGDDADLRHRVQVAELPLLYVMLIRWEALRQEAESEGLSWPVDERIEAVYEQFMTIARAEQVTMVAEARPIEWLTEVADQTASRLGQDP